MKTESHLFFPPFHLDLPNERLWRGSQLISLRPKTFTVLRYLVEHDGQLVTKEELLGSVWRGIRVSEALPKDYIQELRKALQDNPKVPQFIETVHGRGYRFIAPLTTNPPPVQSPESRVRSLEKFGVQSLESQQVRSPQSPIPNPQSPSDLVGREAELEWLQSYLEKARQGQRQTVFVTGEPGIGKTTMVEAFLQRAATERNLCIARGQCLEQYGLGEAYMPVLEALGQLCREPGGERLLEIFGRHAPTWLVQMPWLVSTADLEMLQRRIQGAMRERMLREMAEAAEALTAEQALVLVLEDLH
ncbi:MAG: AAA family ATPase, partial [Deltaproteobacteria bacterium]|nr:AAA family ATPase [Deltaproteobacteria bacterium]